MATISRLYDTYEAAAEAMRNLIEAGVPHSDISLVSNNSESWYSTSSDRGIKRATTTVDRDREGRDDRVEGAEAGAGIGGVAGGIIGLLTGLGLMAIPGVGPVVAAGWLASTAAGAAAGGAAGGIIGALTQAGTSEEDANTYAEGIRRGGTLVSARVPDADRGRYEAILDRSSVVEGAEAGAGIGGVAGGIIGLLTGLGLMAIPGVGPVVAAGWLASTAAGAAAGGATGGIIGTLTQAGTTEEDANAYAEGVRRGGTLVSARVPDADRGRYEAILDRSSVNIRYRGTAWRNEGWQRFDPNASPYTADQIRSARETYRNQRSGLSR